MQRLKDIGKVLLIIAAMVALKYAIDMPDGPPGGKVGVLTEAAFADSVLKSGVPVAVDFRSQSCPACKLFRYKFEDASVRYDGKMKFYEFDINDGVATAGRYGIEALPTTHLFVGGRVVATLRGNVSKADLDRGAQDAIARTAAARTSVSARPPQP